VVAGSGYIADGRTAAPEDPNGRPWQFAVEMAHLDVCVADTGLRLLELNPFSGADLYGCSGADIVRRVAAIVREAV
jgi:hypothetical protein